MDIQQILEMYARSPQSAALARMFCDCGMRVGYVDSVAASVMPVLFASVSRSVSGVCVIVLDDAEEAGYFYHDMTQMLGTGDVLFFPSSYRRRIKYGQHDQASEILRTEVLGRLLAESEELRVKSEELIAEGGETEAGQKNSSLLTLHSSLLYIVTCPEALSELVVSRKKLDERTVILGAQAARAWLHGSGLCLRAGAVRRARQHIGRVLIQQRISFPSRLFRRRDRLHQDVRGAEPVVARQARTCRSGARGCAACRRKGFFP